MNERLVEWSPLILVALLAALTFWLDRKVQQPVQGVDGRQRHDPDFSIEGFSATRMNLDGSRRYQLSARRMAHFPDDNSSRVESPRLVFFDPTRAPVTVRADLADVRKGGEEVFFHGDVQLVRNAFQGNPELGIFTSFLHVVPDRDFAGTDKPVRMVEGNSTASAVGLEFHNKTQQLKLLSQAKVNYANPRRSSGRAPASGATR